MRILAILNENEDKFFKNRSRGLNIWNFKCIDEVDVNEIKFFDCILIDVQNISLLEVLSFKNSVALRTAIAQKPLLVYTQETKVTSIKSFSFDDFVVDTASTTEIYCRLEIALDKRKTPDTSPRQEEVEKFTVAEIPTANSESSLLNDITLHEPRDNADKVIIGVLKFSASGFGVEINGKSANLTYRELELFSLFVNNPNFVFTRSQILSILWEQNDSTSRLVDVHIRRIRSKIGINYARNLSTVRGHGYSWQTTT
ncbi:MAG: winged helix-turn-helix domain-containing protein [Candidatus Ancillula sp.]|nr:winged helix-turn-helix domain-containing protein [Candidatus Ancillula sp.]